MSSPNAPGPGGAIKSELRLGKMHLVDLAGSERLALSGAEGDTRLETQNINLSLTALGKPRRKQVYVHIHIFLLCSALFVVWMMHKKQQKLMA